MKTKIFKMLSLQLVVLMCLLTFSSVSIASEVNNKLISIDVDGKVLTYDIGSSKYKDVEDLLSNSKLVDPSILKSSIFYPRSLEEIFATHNLVIRSKKEVKVTIYGKTVNVSTYSSLIS